MSPKLTHFVQKWHQKCHFFEGGWAHNSCILETVPTKIPARTQSPRKIQNLNGSMNFFSWTFSMNTLTQHHGGDTSLCPHIIDVCWGVKNVRFDNSHSSRKKKNRQKCQKHSKIEGFLPLFDTFGDFSEKKFFRFFGKPLKICIFYSTFWHFLKGVSKSGRKCQKVLLNTTHWIKESHRMLQSHRITDSHRISENS